MKVYFPPSLLNISLSKVAVSICYAKDLNYLMAGFQYRHKCDHGETRDLIQSVVEKGNEIIFALQIPKSLKETLTGVFKATVLDINIWFSEHKFFLHIYFDILSSLHWNAEGSINRLKTAQALIQRNEASDILLLTLAATYCLEVDLERLWVNVVISEEISQWLNHISMIWNITGAVTGFKSFTIYLRIVSLELTGLRLRMKAS
ncbi:hypothetical protein CEXT_30791 [Caerostris extrusa]|uniref:Uncharacterized protein n=1 Tax=Caerostris extrusa TaxID=172846 RepID=A0AAV4WQ22_CAEEX|nr:hypothetical protein CEXT_30791 [Caerostris extrusa]